jgi:hypothetical protein
VPLGERAEWEGLSDIGEFYFDLSILKSIIAYNLHTAERLVIFQS